jgi:hypothetical protein
MGALAGCGPRSRASEPARCGPRLPPSPGRPAGALTPRRAPAERPVVRWLLRSSLTHVRVRSLRSSQPPSPGRPAGALTLLPIRAGRPWARWPAAVLAHGRPSPLAAVLAGRLPLDARPAR